MYKMVSFFKQGGQQERFFAVSETEMRAITDKVATAMEKGSKTMTLTGLDGNTIILHLPNIGAITFDKS